jgi:hypothetical protein
MVPPFQHLSVRKGSRLLGVLAILAASFAASYLLLPNPLADVFFAGWVLGSVALALVGGIAAWTNRTPLVWVAALLLTALSFVALTSIGLYIAPAGLLLLGSALLSQLAGPREEVRDAIAADPPTVQEAVLKTLAGTVSVAVGAGLVYVGAFTRELFGACATESLACALEKTHWDAVGMTVVGLVGVGLGGWLIWKQVYVARVLASKHIG